AGYFLDFYCPTARLAVELDGFQHGVGDNIDRDEKRDSTLAAEGVEVLRIWNHQWRSNRDGVLLDIWAALNRRSGHVKVERKQENHRYVPPDPGQLIAKPAKPAMWRPKG